MTEIIDLLLTMSQEIKDIKARIELIKYQKTERFKDNWINAAGSFKNNSINAGNP